MSRVDELNESILTSFIPFEKQIFRPGQFDAIKQIVEAIEDGEKFIILNAPVGLGKSLVAYVLAKLMELHGEQTYIYTKTKMLQDQYIKDFKDVKLVKGRMNFPCLADSVFQANNGICQQMANHQCDRKPALKEDGWVFDGMWMPHMLPEDESIFNGMCEYWKQKFIGMIAPISMLNYNYAISDTRFVNHFHRRKLLICDEGHNIEGLLMSELETRFAPAVIEKETQFKITDHLTMDQWIDDVEELISIYQGLVKNTRSESKEKTYKERILMFRSLHSLLVDDPQNWVLTQEKERGQLYYIFKPVRVSDYSDLIFSNAEHVVIMSGTILKADIFARDLGIDKYKYIEIPSIIPIENRPIIKQYVGSMSRASLDDTMPNMALKIHLLAEKHQDEKGVIHTFTYNIANRLKKALKGDNRFIFHTQKDKDRRFKEFKKNKTNKILVSPVAFEGVDFPYDDARWQCICKDPFPNIGDPQLRVRDATDYGWLFRQRCLTLSQMYGRTNRAADDYSVTYLLDSRLESLLGPATLVTDYFLEAVEGMNYATKMVLNPNAYECLTPDNKRKTHEVDRFQEVAILDAIQDEGLDTLDALRRAYKEMPNESYTLVIPTINRLLKNGAIRYVGESNE